MDSYGPNVAYYASFWLRTYSCKASVGLAYPGDALPAMTTFFANLTADANYRSIGERGRLYMHAATCHRYYKHVTSTPP